jgi:hypothetical protein
MAKRKATTKVTMALPDALLEIADFQADASGLDRYDVIKTALANGLAMMELQRQAFAGKFAQEGQAMAAVLGDPDTFAAKVVANVEEESQARKRRKKPAPAAVAEPEPEPEQRQFHGLRPGPRSDLEELEVIGSPLVASDAPVWTGYMRGL